MKSMCASPTLMKSNSFPGRLSEILNNCCHISLHSLIMSHQLKSVKQLQKDYTLKHNDYLKVVKSSNKDTALSLFHVSASKAMSWV